MIAAPRPRASLPRTGRLRSPAAFQRLFQTGARVERPAFILLWVREPGRRAVAFAAGRRLGGSVIRNRARRRLREAYRRQQALLPPEGLRVALLARPGVLTVPFLDLLRQLDSALRQVDRHRG